MKKYRWLLLDADETLFDFKRCERDALRGALEAAGIGFDDRVLERYHVINDAMWKKLELGLIKKEDLKYRRFDEFLDDPGDTGTDSHTLADDYMDRLSASRREGGARAALRAFRALHHHERRGVHPAPQDR